MEIVPSWNQEYPATKQAAALDSVSGKTPAPQIPKANEQHAPIPEALSAQMITSPQEEQATASTPAPSEEAPPKFEDTQPIEEAPPKFEDTQPVDETRTPAEQDFKDILKLPTTAEEVRKQSDKLTNYVRNNLGMAQREWKTKSLTNSVGQTRQVHEAENFYEALESGLQMSGLGGGLRGAAPDVVLGENPSMAFKIAHGIGSLAADLPIMAEAGAFAASQGVTSTAAKMAAQFAVPAAIRKMYADHWDKGDIQSAGDFAARLMSTTWEAIKGGATGAATAVAGPAGGALASKVAPAFAKPVAGAIGSFTSELAAMTSTGALLEGHLPEPEEFVIGGLTMGILHGVGLVGNNHEVSSKLSRIFGNTGEKPSIILDAAMRDPVLKQEILSMDHDLPAQASHTEIDTEMLPEVVAKEGEKPIEEKPRNTLVAKDMTEPPTPMEEQVIKAEKENPEGPNFDENQKYFKDMMKDKTKEEKSLADKIKDPVLKANEEFHDAYARTMDRSSALRRMETSLGIKDGGETASAQLQKFSAAGDVSSHFIEHGTIDWKTGTVNGESFKSIVEDYRKSFPDDPKMLGLKTYGIAARAIELAGRGKELKVNGETVDLVKAQELVDAQGYKYKDFMARDVAYSNRVLDYATDAGLFSKDQTAAMKELNKQHISLQRVIEQADGFSGGKNKTLKKIQGEGGFIKDPILSRLETTEVLTKMALENRVKSTLVNQLTAFTSRDLNGKESNDHIQKVEADSRRIYVKAKEMEKALAEQFIETSEPLTEGMEVIRRYGRDLRPGEFAVMEDGKRAVYKVENIIVAEAVNSMASNPSYTSTMGKVLKLFPCMLRAGTVENPVFAVGHEWRNLRSAAIYSKAGMVPFLDPIRYAPMFLKKGPEFQEALRSQALVSSVAPINENYLNDQIYKLNEKAPFLDRVWNSITNPLTGIKNLNEARKISHTLITLGDNMIRFAEFQKMREKGASTGEAAMSARNVIPDYQKAGIQRDTFLAMTLANAPFSRIHIGSEAQFLSEITGPRSKEILTKALLYQTIPALMIYAMNQNDERVDQQSEYLKSNYDMMAIDRWVPANKQRYETIKNADPGLVRADGRGGFEVNDGPIIRMKTPFTLGVLMSRGPVAAIEAIKKHDPQAVKDWAKELAGSFAANLTPTAALPAIEQMANYNFQTGRPLISAQNEKLLPELQQKPYTTETAVQLGKLIHSMGGSHIGPNGRTFDNPIVLDNYIKAWTGTLGMAAVRFADKGLHAAGIGDTSAQPERDWWKENWAVGAFLVRNPDINIDAVEKLYHAADMEKRAQNSLKEAMKRGDEKTVNSIMTEYGGDMYGAQGSAKAMSAQISIINAVKHDQSMNSLEKTQLIENLMWGVMATAKQGVKNLHDLKPQPANNKPTEE